jgi:hypothetical protein
MVPTCAKAKRRLPPIKNPTEGNHPTICDVWIMDFDEENLF